MDCLDEEGRQAACLPRRTAASSPFQDETPHCPYYATPRFLCWELLPRQTRRFWGEQQTSPPHRQAQETRDRNREEDRRNLFPSVWLPVVPGLLCLGPIAILGRACSWLKKRLETPSLPGPLTPFSPFLNLWSDTLPHAQGDRQGLSALGSVPASPRLLWKPLLSLSLLATSTSTSGEAHFWRLTYLLLCRNSTLPLFSQGTALFPGPYQRAIWP